MAEQGDIFTRVTEIISDKLAIDPKQITPESTFTEDLGADSLDVVELLMALEDEFGIHIEEEEAEQIESVRDVIAFIEEHV
ncbi:MAG: acyl carrier protein [Candidatus Dadabacteria bacterium]|nr:MAG: acyl carrier protein [Candidatus Dadabacteria bacterium]